MHINAFGSTVTDEQEKQALQAEVKHKVEEIHSLLAERDRLAAVITELLAMLEPGEKPDPNRCNDDTWTEWAQLDRLHARSVAIAEGRES